MEVSGFLKQLEQRASIRYGTHVHSIVSLKGHKSFSTITDVSTEGVGFASHADLNVGEIVLLTFEGFLDGVKKVISLVIEVVRCTKGNEQNGFGGKIRTASAFYKDFIELGCK